MEKHKANKVFEKYTSIILLVIITCQLLVITIFGVLKESYHVDELYTFGLSNSFYKPFINWNNETNIWHSPEYYNDYLTVQTDELFAYDSVYYNQVNDVHPPFYYFGIHTICSFFPNIFSKWIGIGYNMLFYLGTVLCLFYLSKLIFNDILLAILICIAYGFSAGAISCAIFIRMYMIVTFFIVLLTYLYGLLIVGRGSKFINIFAIVLINILGFLTQYIFIIYAFLIAYGYFVYLLKDKKWKLLFFYGVAMIVSIVLGVGLFPESLNHIFDGYRGVEAIRNFSIMKDFISRTTIFLLLLSNSFAILPIILIIIFATKLFYFINNKNQNKNILYKTTLSNYNNLSNEKRVFLKIIAFSTFLSFLIIAKISPYYEERYFAYLLPNISILSIHVAYIVLADFFNDSRKVLNFLTLLIIIGTVVSHISGGVNYLYSNKGNDLDTMMSKYYNYNAYCVANTGVNMTIPIPLLMKHYKSCYTSNKEDTIKKIIENENGEAIVLYFPDWDKIQDSNSKDLEYIIDHSLYDSYEQLVSNENSGACTNIYLLK